MSRSRPKPKRAKGAAAQGRWRTAGLFATLLAVAVLAGSLAWGLWDHFRGDRPASAAVSKDTTPDLAANAPAGRVRVQVLNATKTPGLARRATDVLRDRGFDVVETGNAAGTFPPDSSVVLDRVGRLETARAVADAIGIRRVHARHDPNLYLDVTVVLGADWQAPAAAGEEEQRAQ